MSPGSPAFKPAVLSRAVVPEHEMISPIASGAYGQVWMARNRFGAYRAIKIVHRASFDHDRPFEREFAGLKAFEPVSRTHEGLVDLLQVGRDDAAGYFYYVMELADDENAERGARSDELGLDRASVTLSHPMGEGRGEGIPHSALRTPHSYAPRTLKSELNRRGRLPLEECTRIGLSLTEALAHLHGHGLVHRDIKPSNIIFVGGVPKLADVGLVAAMTDARSFVGTEGFIPPEGPGTPQADLYSLGIVLYVLSTGKSHQDFPEPPADLSTLENRDGWLEFNAVVHKACQADVRQRYQSPQEMHEDLALLLHGESVREKRVAQRRWTAAKRLAPAAAGAALLLTALPFIMGTKSGHTAHAEALRLYELGRWHYNQLTPEHHKKALDYLNQAVQMDPQYIDPYRELIALYVWGKPGLLAEGEEISTRIKDIADRLLALNPQLAEGHTALSWYKFLMQDWAGAEDEIVRSISLNPNDPTAHDLYGSYLSLLGRTDEALRQSQLSQDLAPTALATGLIAAFPFLAARQFDRAIAQAKRVLELDKNFGEAHNFLGRCYEAQSNYLAAIEEFKTFDMLSGHDPARLAAAYDRWRQAYDSRGQEGYFREVIELIREDATLPATEQMFHMEDIAGYYAMLGEKDKAMDEIERLFDSPAVRPLEPLYDTLHDEPRFKALVRRAGLEP